MSTDQPLLDGLDPALDPSPASSGPDLSQLIDHTHELAAGIAAALAQDTPGLLAGPADLQDGPEDLLPPGAVRGVIAGLRDAPAVQVVLILGESIAIETHEDDAAGVNVAEPWMAPLATSMERWAGDLGGQLVNAMAISEAEQIRHLLVTSSETVLIAAGLFTGTELVGSVAVVGRVGDQQHDDSSPARDTGGVNAAILDAMATDDPPQRTSSPIVDAMHVLAEVEMTVTAELGRTRMSVAELLALTPGSLIELDRTAGSPIDLLVNGTLIARGEVVVVDEEYGIRITEISGSTEL